uniref:Hsp20/alpha crystallin family protein n=1 Tax=candidate division WOR-3 bacterium TaxID=2052148 RepID=A0A7C4GFL1_UNCW3
MARNIAPWEPFAGVSTLRDEMDRLFDAFTGRLTRGREDGYWIPPLDIEETKDALIVRAELPGMKKDEIKVSISGDTLTLSGERRHETEEKGKTFCRIERAYGRFQRSVVLPAEIDGDKAKAAYKAGVLELTLPKSARSKAHEITIVAED